MFTWVLTLQVYVLSLLLSQPIFQRYFAVISLFLFDSNLLQENFKAIIDDIILQSFDERTFLVKFPTVKAYRWSEWHNVSLFIEQFPVISNFLSRRSAILLFKYTAESSLENETQVTLIGSCSILNLVTQELSVLKAPLVSGWRNLFWLVLFGLILI